jgi:hypothetical protein
MASSLCDYARPIGLLPTEPEQLLEMTELVPRPVLYMEVFHNHIGVATLGGLATSGECLQLHNRLPWKPWHPLLERTHDRCLPRRLRQLAHKCTGPPLLNGGTSLPPHNSNSHPLFCINPAPHGPSKGQSVGLRAQCCCCASNTSKFGSSAIVGTCASPCVCSLNCPSAPLSSHAPLSTSTCSGGAYDNWAVVLPGELWGSMSSAPKTC